MPRASASENLDASAESVDMAGESRRSPGFGAGPVAASDLPLDVVSHRILTSQLRLSNYALSRLSLPRTPRQRRPRENLMKARLRNVRGCRHGQQERRRHLLDRIDLLGRREHLDAAASRKQSLVPP